MDFDPPASVVPLLKLRLRDGSEVEVTAGYVDMKVQLIKLAPQIGQLVRIKRLRKAGQKVLFDVEVRNAAKPAAKADTPPPADDPFATEEAPF